MECSASVLLLFSYTCLCRNVPWLLPPVSNRVKGRECVRACACNSIYADYASPAPAWFRTAPYIHCLRTHSRVRACIHAWIYVRCTWTAGTTDCRGGGGFAECTLTPYMGRLITTVLGQFPGPVYEVLQRRQGRGATLECYISYTRILLRGWKTY